ncbi:hypothetical protein Ga0080574_TMP2114 [Salipiger abyssi]|uniref:Uncharacterized protein n=1 Tax=Salipiger abyssi TaxID=1250539 RepID=A0A1P8USW8_9RHOB|nr:hypothetical protein Ga0080574_TMP2114 [Salipiger abyssi]
MRSPSVQRQQAEIRKGPPDVDAKLKTYVAHIVLPERLHSLFRNLIPYFIISVNRSRRGGTQKTCTEDAAKAAPERIGEAITPWKIVTLSKGEGHRHARATPPPAATAAPAMAVTLLFDFRVTCGRAAVPPPCRDVCRNASMPVSPPRCLRNPARDRRCPPNV